MDKLIQIIPAPQGIYMQAILKELEKRVVNLEKVGNAELTLPGDNDPDTVIMGFLNHQQGQRETRQQLSDLLILQQLIQEEITRITDHDEAEQAVIEEQGKIKQRKADTKKLIKQLNKGDLCTPEAAKQLLELSILGR
ncbi:MAG TPA: hypothetical protein PKV15_07150 [Syntrophomonadaceae bacterium]|jgi:hypothetical protein|nr:hypothetical protein [Syntrophomonadaceae bacterium]HPF44460.1 hypothetical protein [Syntrophomonadaceae bacterium]